MPDLSYIIESAVLQEEGEMLCALSTEDEVRAATLSIPVDSAPGLDGYRSAFFIKCWDIIKRDLVEAAKDFFERRGATLILYIIIYCADTKDRKS